MGKAVAKAKKIIPKKSKLSFAPNFRPIENLNNCNKACEANYIFIIFVMRQSQINSNL